ncbi:hypothetical protein BDE18_4281 [Paracoccus pantotrophus]|uniref:Glutaredoxin-like protein NrdH n=2 Tax=Paracoccus TaxID=265 RepID=A0ABX9S5K1_PARPN|nr:hypothetical protein BDE18_4281 [Paracoccus pantotrophus]
MPILMRTSTKGIGYQLVDLTTDDEAMKQVVALGYRQAPVVVAGDTHWAGFRPDLIAGIKDPA